MLVQIDPRLAAALKDDTFMRQLDEYPHKEKYARITSLDWDETPIEQIEGKVTAGTINLDGNSAARRSCSLTLEAQVMDIHDYYWGLKTKFKLEIGLANAINSQYPDIIWFNQGIYIFTSFNSSVTPTGYTFSVQGKDKMCLLDGSMGGNLPSQIDFGQEEVITYNYEFIPLTEQDPTYCWIPYELAKDTRDFPYVEQEKGSDEIHHWDLNDVEINKENNTIQYYCKLCGEPKFVNVNGSSMPRKLPDGSRGTSFVLSDANNYQISSTEEYQEVPITLTASGLTALDSWTLQLYWDSEITLTKIVTITANTNNTTNIEQNAAQPYNLSGKGSGSKTLYFKIPVNKQGRYDINLVSMLDKIVDSSGNPIAFTITNTSITVGYQNTLTKVNYGDFRYKKVLYDKSFSRAYQSLEGTVFQVIREKTPRESAKEGYYYNANKFPHVFRISSTEEDTPIYYCLNRDEVKVIESIPIKRIIKEAVHKYANEPYHNIIISDLDITGQELLEYRGSDPIYLFYNIETASYDNLGFYGVQEVQECDENGNTDKYGLIRLDNIIYKSFNYLTQAESDCTYFKINGVEDSPIYQASKISYGETIGYRETALTYPGELIANIGENLVSVLDKIKNMLGEYEYFYNLEGQFVFQRKQTYLNNSWSSILTDTDDSRKKYVMPAVYANPVQYSFVNNNLFTSMSNNPQLGNIKNDFSVWGSRKTTTGADRLIHFRIGIQSKPETYTSYKGVRYIYDTKIYKAFEAECDSAYNTLTAEGVSKDQLLIEYYNKYLKEYLKPFENQGIVYVSDWRELIYQMAIDNLQNGQKDDFLYMIEKNNPQMHLGRTGYEHYYEDIVGFWRDIYDPAPLNEIVSQVKTRWETVSDATGVYNYQVDAEANPDWKHIRYTSREYFEPDYPVNMNYSLAPPLDVTSMRDSNFWLPTRKGTSFDIEYEYVYKMEGGYYCQSPQGAKAYLQLLSGKEVAVIGSNGQPLFQKTNESTGNYVSETYKWKHIGDGSVWFLAKVDGYHQVMVKQGNEYKKAYSYYYNTKKNENVFYTTATRDGTPYIDCRDLYYDAFPSDFINRNLGFKWVRSTEYSTIRIPHQYVVKVVEENKQFDAITNFNVSVTDAPEQLDFWLELIDPSDSSEFYNYRIETIGVRSKAVNDSGVKAIYYKETPNVIFVNQNHWDTLDTHKSGYTYIQIPDYYAKYFSISSQGKSAKDAIDELLYQFTGYNEQITLASVPIYYLPLNGLIQIADKSTDINGDYIVNRISLPLAYNGMMNINASRAIKRII